MYIFFLACLAISTIIFLLLAIIHMFLDIFKRKDHKGSKTITYAIYAVFIGSLTTYLSNAPALTPGQVLLIFKTIGIVTLIITLHELGHYTAAKIFRVPVSQFSVGIGPKLIKFMRGKTIFEWRLLPLKGHVLVEINKLEKLSFMKKCIFFLAGIFVNLLCFIVGMSIYLIQNGTSLLEAFNLAVNKLITAIPNFYDLLMNIRLSDIYTPERDLENSIGGYFVLSEISQDFWFGFAALSLLLALFNLVPIPILDGGRVVLELFSKFFTLLKVPVIYVKKVYNGLLIGGFMFYISPIIVNNIWSSSISMGISVLEYVLWTLLAISMFMNIQIFIDNKRINQ